MKKALFAGAMLLWAGSGAWAQNWEWWAAAMLIIASGGKQRTWPVVIRGHAQQRRIILAQ